MWIFTPTAFVSIVAHRDRPGMLMVRARLRGDLERMFPGVTVTETPDADYLFRCVVPRESCAQLIADQVRGLDYPNVKSAIPHQDRIDDLRASAMSDVWGVMHQAQRDQDEFVAQVPGQLLEGWDRDGQDDGDVHFNAREHGCIP